MNTFVKSLSRFALIITLSLLANVALGFSTTGNECPDKFAGVVTKVLHPGPTQNAPDMIEVHFEVIEKLGGNPEQSPVIKVLKFGPFKFFVGDEYIVSLRNGFLCMAEINR